MDKMKMRTPDLTEENIKRLAALFPNVITEIKDDSGVTRKAIDFDLLKQVLSKDIVEGDDERYRLDWPGKKAALLKANIPLTKTLRPCREESVNFDATENLYIEGDNFEVLKVLQESYLGKVKMIYIDPPYNTGNDFIYKDNFTKNKAEYEEEIGVENEEGGKLFRNTDSNGRFHSDWLSMMYERLVVARDLLKNDGVIFISIDEHELASLAKSMEEIFGSNNMDFLIWRKNGKQGNTKKINRFKITHEYILVGYKNKYETFIAKTKLMPNWKGEKANPDNDPRGPWESGVISRAEEKSNVNSENYYSITLPSGRIMTREFFVDKETFNSLIAENKIYFPKDGDGVPRLKIFENEEQNYFFDSIIDEMGTFTDAREEINEVFNNKEFFDTPKPTKILKELTRCSTEKDDIIIDFFSGSATTAHAVMQLNAEDGGNRKFIMVQLPEKTDENSEAYKAGYKTIADIGKERIRRAGKKIVEELKEKNKQPELGQEPVDASKLDIGFRVYKTDESNMKDVFYHPAKLDQKQLAFVESNIKEDRTPEDLLTQVILDLGLELSLPIETKKMGKNTVFVVQTNALVACFDNDIDFKIVDTIAGLKPFKVVFKDASFKDDKDRINVEERFKRLSPETKVTVI
jgi:adenine-specific DNA-methyltransferase